MPFSLLTDILPGASGSWHRRFRALLRFLVVYLCTACGLLPAGMLAHAAASQPVQLAATSPAFYPAPLQVAQGLSLDTTVAQVAALPADRFEAFSPKTLYKLSVNTPLWLKLPISAREAAPSSAWLLEFPSIIVDRYEFYQRGANGQWSMTAAGDRVAHSQWPLKGLRARFALQAPSAGEHDVFVRVVHQHQTNFQPMVVLASQATAHDARQMLWLGLLLGVVFTLVLSCFQMTMAYRDYTYAWYAGYLLSTLLAALCYSGIAQSTLWPDATKFASDAVVYSVMAALIFNLEFTRSMFGGSQTRRVRWLSRVLVALCLGYMVATFLSERYERLIIVFEVLSLAVFAFIIVVAVRAWRSGVPFSGYWLTLYLPYLLCIALTLANSAGFVSAPWLPSQTPVLAVILEAVAMMLCINAYGRLRHAQAVREQEAALHDPLTGFLRAPVFNSKVAALWQKAQHAGRDMAIVYVLVEPVDTEVLGTVDTEALMARSVRQVRTIVRDTDIVGRIGRNRIGIAMRHAPTSASLSGRLARLIALGLMLDSDDPTALTARFSMGVGLRHGFAGDFNALDAALRKMMAGSSQKSRAIRYLDADKPPSDWAAVKQ